MFEMEQLFLIDLKKKNILWEVIVWWGRIICIRGCSIYGEGTHFVF